MKPKSAFRLLSDLIPRYVEEEAAMVFKGNVLIPVCCIQEWEYSSDPDAVCIYRMIRWLGSDWCVSRIDLPPYSVKESKYAKEKETKSWEDQKS